MSIRSKLFMLLLLPIAALAIVSLAGLRDQRVESDTNDRAQLLADTLVSLDDLAQRVGDERMALARGDSRDAVGRATAATDAAIEQLRVRGGEPAAVANEVATTLDAQRGQISSTAFRAYQAALVDIREAVQAQPLGGFSSDAVVAAQGLAEARIALDLQEHAWFEFFALETVVAEDVSRVASAFSDAEQVRRSAAATVMSSGRRPYDVATSSSTARDLVGQTSRANEDLVKATPNEIAAPEVFALLTDSRLQWNEAIAAERSVLQADAVARDGEISSRESLFWLLALLGALLLGTAIIIIGRSILGPFSRLIDHADTMTKEQLPAAVGQLRELGASDEIPQITPIPRESDDELGSLVDAFNSMQETAVQIATDQAKSRRNVAELFVNLGRRNQKLNQRMLEMISDLEQNEQNPETLDGLYRLDHIATRMRRNAESLLVLAGNRSPRQWSQPVPIEDVVRSAIGEVEAFDRVEIGDLPDAFIQGAVVADVTHLLAELLDNATQFSDPSKPVLISAHEELEGVEVEIFDEGIGIAEPELDALNDRINNPPALDEAPSRMLGLFVVGRLAEQHGVTVQLESKQRVGTVATVALPASIMPDEVFVRPGSTVEMDAETRVEQELADLAAFGLAGPAEAPAPSAEVASADAAPLEEEVEAWAPSALHEEDLADASVPTMDEVIEAIPSFGFDTPDEVAPAEEPLPEQWPSLQLTPVPEPGEPPTILIESIDDVDDESALIAISEMYSPAGEDLPAPAEDVAEPVDVFEPQLEEFSELPAPPILGGSLPAPPIVASEPPAVAPEPEPEAPLSRPPLPTRTPQAALDAVEMTEIADVEPVGFADIAAVPDPSAPQLHDPEVASSLPSPFASFADGVSRGLGELEEAPKPQFSNAFDPEELS